MVCNIEASFEFYRNICLVPLIPFNFVVHIVAYSSIFDYWNEPLAMWLSFFFFISSRKSVFFSSNHEERVFLRISHFWVFFSESVKMNTGFLNISRYGWALFFSIYPNGCYRRAENLVDFHSFSRWREEHHGFDKCGWILPEENKIFNSLGVTPNFDA